MAEFTADSKPSETPAFDAVMKGFMDDFHAGRLPSDIQQRMEDARDSYTANLKDDLGNLQARAVDLLNDLKQEVGTVATDYLATHPELASMSDVNEKNMDAAGVMVASRELLHKMVEASDILAEFIDDFAHDTFDTVDEVLEIRAAADDGNTLGAQLVAAESELEVAEASLDEALDRWSGERQQAQDSIDAIADFAADHPAEFNAQLRHHQEMVNEANKVQPDPIEVGESATA